MTRKLLNPITLATVIVIIYTIMPILSVFISSYLTTYAYMALVVLLLGFILLTGGLKRFSEIIRLIIPFAVYVILTFFTNSSPILLWGYQNMLFLLPVILGFYYIDYQPEKMGLFAKVLIFATLITAVTTIIGVIQFPEAARILATIAASDDLENIKYSWHNIGGYNFVYTCVLLYPVLILAYKQKKIKRAVFLFAFLSMLVLLIFAEYTIALLLFIISSATYFISKRANPGQTFVIGVILAIVLFAMQPLFERFLLWLADTLNSEVFSERLTALAGGIEGVEGSESNRVELYLRSLRGFWSSPLFGKIFGESTTVGGHSFIFDSLANYGALGGATMIFMYRNIYRMFFKPLENVPGYGHVMWIFIQSIILSAVNPGMWLTVLAFFAPVLLSLIYDKNSEGTYENSLDS